MTALTYGKKTYTLTSPDIARAMLFCGNPYGHNRAKVFRSEKQALSFALKLNLNPAS